MEVSTKMHIMRVLNECSWMLLKGLGVTLHITIASLLVAIVIGFLICIARISRKKSFSLIGKFYIWLIRGTPLTVQVFFVYFALPQLIQQLFHINFRIRSPYLAGLITLSLNAGAYISEIFRGGVEAVDKGQMEAARSLGISRKVAMSKIIFPQALKITTPSLINQFIITLKDTSIVSVISLKEVVYEAKVYIGSSMEMLSTWTIVAILYLAIITVLSKFSSYIERKFSYDYRN